MAGKMSRDKGQRAEREVIRALQTVVNEVWGECFPHDDEPPKLQRNTLQSDEGGFDIAGLGSLMAIEVKHQERLQVEKWWEQAVRQANGKLEPVLIYRQNNVKFRVRIWASIWVFGHNEHVGEVVEISMDAFLRYFNLRIRAAFAESKKC